MLNKHHRDYRKRFNLAAWTPRFSDFEHVFTEQNPWHSQGAVPPSLAPPVERPLAQLLWQRLLRDDPLRYQLVLGPRRVGKTTVLYQTVRHLLERVEPQRVWWLRMDHPLLLQMPLDELVRAILDASAAATDCPSYLMLDELVYAADWDLWLKTFYDERWPVRIAATSSATAALKERRVESGVGRWEEQYLMPYLFDEFLHLIDPQPEIPVERTLGQTLRALPSGRPADAALGRWRRVFLFVGGFPELIARQHRDEQPDESNLLLASQRVLRSDAVERTIYKDIPQSFGVHNPMMLERVLYVLAGQIAGLLSPSNISHDLDLSQPTFDRYLSYLERAFLVFTLPNYAGRELGIQRRGRKLYFVDGAVRNAALQRGIAPLDDPGEMGTLIENIVATSLHTLSMHAGLRLHHWRASTREVDLIWGDPHQPLAFEIGTSTHHARAGLRALMERHEHFRGHSYLVAPHAAVRHPDASGMGTLPLDTFLLAVGAQAHQALADRLRG